MKRVLVVAGHRNIDGGGGDIEARENGERVRALLDLYERRGGARALGFELRTTTPDKGLGMSGLGLAQAFSSGFDDDWIPDFACELNSDSAQGGHMVYPDWGQDVDEELKRFGRVFAEELKDATEMPIGLGNSGLLSEKGTAVGGGGHRLGIFSSTVQFRRISTRCAFEQGAHGVPAMREILTRADFPDKAAVAFIAALERWFDATSPGWRIAPPITVPPPVSPALPKRAASAGMIWAELIDGFEGAIQLLEVDWTFEKRVMKARRAAPCWSSPKFKAETRENLAVGEVVTVVLKGKAPAGGKYAGKTIRATIFGSIIVGSALGPA